MLSWLQYTSGIEWTNSNSSIYLFIYLLLHSGKGFLFSDYSDRCCGGWSASVTDAPLAYIQCTWIHLGDAALNSLTSNLVSVHTYSEQNTHTQYKTSNSFIYCCLVLFEMCVCACVCFASGLPLVIAKGFALCTWKTQFSFLMSSF